MILAGDIGGTTTRLAVFEATGARLDLLAQADFPSGRYPGLEAILSEFLEKHPAVIEVACFGIAGPVRQGRVETPNLSWVVDGKRLARLLGLDAPTRIAQIPPNSTNPCVVRPAAAAASA